VLGEGRWGSREEDERRGGKERGYELLLQLVCPAGVRKRWGSGEFVVSKDTRCKEGKDLRGNDEGEGELRGGS